MKQLEKEVEDPEFSFKRAEFDMPLIPPSRGTGEMIGDFLGFRKYLSWSHICES